MAGTSHTKDHRWRLWENICDGLSVRTGQMSRCQIWQADWVFLHHCLKSSLGWIIYVWWGKRREILRFRPKALHTHTHTRSMWHDSRFVKRVTTIGVLCCISVCDLHTLFAVDCSVNMVDELDGSCVSPLSSDVSLSTSTVSLPPNLSHCWLLWLLLTWTVPISVCHCWPLSVSFICLISPIY